MKIYAINGGPRKGWNSETMLQHFLKGAKSASPDVEVEMVHLYDLNYKGCISCYACQRNNDATYGQCQVKDDIYQLLRDMPISDGVAFGCPIYLGDLTAELRAFIERLVYQYSSYDTDKESSNAPKKLRTATIYTMNVKQHVFEQLGYDHILGHAEQYLNDIFGHPPVRICAYDIYQHKDYSKYRATYWNEQEKAEHHRIQFPLDCMTAYEAGQHMVLDAMAEKQ